MTAALPRRTVSCPACWAPVEWLPANPYRPFCSERCRLIDLGAWATESYRVPVGNDAGDRDSAFDSDA